MSVKRQVLSFILSVLIVFSAVPTVSAQAIAVGDRFDIDGNTVTICRELYACDRLERFMQYYVLQSDNRFAIYDADAASLVTPFFENVYFSVTNGRYVVFSDSATRSEYGIMDMSGTVVLPLRKGFYTLHTDDTVSYLEEAPDGTLRNKKLRLSDLTEIPATEPYAAELFFHEATPFESRSEIVSATMVFDDGTCADLADEDIELLLSALWNFNCERSISHVTEKKLSCGYYLLRNADASKVVTVYDLGNVLTARFGEAETAPNGEQNYVIYKPMRGNAKNVLLTIHSRLLEKYQPSARACSEKDKPFYPEQDLLSLDGCSDWAQNEIRSAAAKKLLPFDLANNYTAPITRREFCQLAIGLLANDVYPSGDSLGARERARYTLIDAVQNAETDPDYSDCTDLDVKALSAAGILRGVGNGKFAPERAITREEAATILYRLANYRKCVLKIPEEAVRFSDTDSAHEWAIDAISVMARSGILQGVSDSEFSPKGYYTKEQAIATVLRLSDYPAHLIDEESAY